MARFVNAQVPRWCSRSGQRCSAASSSPTPPWRWAPIGRHAGGFTGDEPVKRQ